MMTVLLQNGKMTVYVKDPTTFMVGSFLRRRRDLFTFIFPPVGKK